MQEKASFFYDIIPHAQHSLFQNLPFGSQIDTDIMLGSVHPGGVKEHFGFQNICKQRLSLAYVSGGRTRVLRFLTLTAPVVIGGIVLGDNTFI